MLALSISGLSQNLILVRNTVGKYGFTDKSGDTIIECKFDYAENFSEGLALVKNNLQFKIIDTTGKLYDLSEYDGSQKFRHNLGEYHTGLPVIVKVWDCGYISSSGEYYLKIPYTDATSFVNGKAKVFDGENYNIITKNGMLLSSWKPIDYGYHAIKRGDKFGFIDQNGKLVIDYKYQNATDFHDGFAYIKKLNYMALINKKGEKFTDWYEKIGPFIGNVAIVYRANIVGLINKQGKFIGQWYQQITPMDFGLFKVEKYNQYAIVNQDGYLVTQWFDKIGSFKNGFVKVEKDGKYAYLNKLGGQVIGWFDKINDIKEGIITVEENGQYGFYNVESFYISPLFDYLGDFVEGYAIVGKQGKYTYINKKGEELMPFELDTCYNFKGGIAKVVKNNEAAYINTNGDVVMGWYKIKHYFNNEPPIGVYVVKIGNSYYFETLNGQKLINDKFDYAENFSEGLALVKNNPEIMYIQKDGKVVPTSQYPKNANLRLDLGVGHSGKPFEIIHWECVFIDYNGDVKIDLTEYDDAHSFNNGKAMVIRGDKYNYIDKKGKLLGDWVDYPDDYHASFKNGFFGFIDKNGKLVIDYKFNFASDFKNGMAKVRIGSNKDAKYAYINRSGKYKTKLYNELSDFDHNLAIAGLDGKYVVIDTSGKEISQIYDKIYKYREGMARVEKDGKYSFINRKGFQFSDWYENAEDFVGGRAKIKMYDKWGFVSRDGTLAVRPDYDQVWNYQNNIAKVKKDNKYAFIDLNGKLITEWFDRLYMFSEDRAVIALNNKWGYVDIYGKIVIKPKYDKAFAFNDGKAMVIKEGKMIYIDKNGTELPPEN